jgi:hypothetical protein
MTVDDQLQSSHALPPCEVNNPNDELLGTQGGKLTATTCSYYKTTTYMPPSLESLSTAGICCCITDVSYLSQAGPAAT